MQARHVFIAAGLIAFAACAPAMRGGADQIARLEQARAAQPRSAATARSLGIAYYQAERHPEARAALEAATRLDPRDGLAALFLGLTAEAQDDLATARAAYGTYLQFGRTARVRRQLEARLAALARRELALAARAAIAQEAELSGTPGSPRTVAVFPFSFSGVDSTLRPLERGFAELVITDLARSSQLTVVERGRLQLILAELALQQTGATDSATALRAGRILQAGRVVQGSLLQQGEQLRADAAVVNVTGGDVVGSRGDNEDLEQLFTLQKTIVFGIFDALGVTLTTAERNAIEQRPTRSLAAFLSFSRGLEMEDLGRYDEASEFFRNAVRLDPAFAPAQQKGAETQAVAAGGQVSATSVETALRGTTEGQMVSAGAQGAVDRGGTALGAAADLNPSQAQAASGGPTTAAPPPQQDPAGRVGSDNPSQVGTVRIIIRSP